MKTRSFFQGTPSKDLIVWSTFLSYGYFICHEKDGRTQGASHKSHLELLEILAGLDGSIAPYMSGLCEQRMVSRWVLLSDFQ